MPNLVSCCRHIGIVRYVDMPKRISSDIEQQICEAYDSGTGVMRLAKQFVLHRATIQKTLIRNRVKLRKTSPYINTYDVKFFDTYTAETCYWAGFILADGCVRSDRDCVNIHLQSGDREHLVKFAKSIGFAGQVEDDQKGKSCRISVAGKWFPNALRDQFSISSRKSLTSTFPVQVPSKHWAHLIRGIFDGDGSISYVYQADGRIIPILSFIGTTALLGFLRKHFHTLGVSLKSRNKYAPIVDHQTEGIGYLSYSGKNAMLILDYLMKESAPSTRLDRKHIRYEGFKNFYG